VRLFKFLRQQNAQKTLILLNIPKKEGPMKRTMVLRLIPAAVMASFLALQLNAQTSLQIPVTFYDYHSDGSNPDFEPGLHTCGTVGCITTGPRPNEVADTLDAQGKPVLGTACLFSNRVAKWFRPWQAGDFTIPIYSTAGAYLGDTTILTDTSYTNVVIPDTLTLNAVAGLPGIYQLNSAAFFRLDGKGYGADDPGGQNPPHNFGFAMELHYQFTFQPGLVFSFSGDDDVWVFINGHKVIDLGGIHGPTGVGGTASVSLDTLGGMTAGNKYHFDLFYAERHVTGSDILITTNIFSPAGAIHLYGNNTPPVTPTNPTPLGPLDSANAGQGFPLYVHVFDSLGVWQPSWDSTVVWTLTAQNGMGNPVLTTQTGGSTMLIPEKAFGTVTITATYTQNGKTITTSITVYVNPGRGTHVVIEGDSLAANTRADRPIDTITVDKINSKTVYAVVRDTFGNFVDLAPNAIWLVTDPTIAAVTPGTGKSTSVSELLFGKTTLTVTVSGITPGTATINAVGPNNAIPVTAILLDTNGNGHLDRIDLVYPTNVALSSVLPSARAWVQSAGIISDDGNTPVTLVVDTLIRGGGDTIHIFLTENTGPILETGWPKPTDAHVTLSSAPVTTDQRAFTVDSIVDGAAPVIKNLCFVPAAGGDTLNVLFSEPVTHDNLPGGANSLFTIQSGGVPTGDVATTVLPSGDRYIYIYNANTLTDVDSVKEGTRPLFPLGLCGNVPIIAESHVATNPFTPGKTVIPQIQQDSTHRVTFGTRIEVTLIPAIQGDLVKGRVTGAITIFDAVGNVIVNKAGMAVDVRNPKKPKLFETWDGKTRKGNYAGGGTYMARIEIDDLVSSKTDVVMKAIGVRQ
jgi:fibro-slime domain-containing protein